MGGLSCWGMTQPLPGETVEVPDVRTLPSGREYQRGVRDTPAWAVRALWAQLCPSCGHLTVLPMQGDDPVTLLLCDGCDGVCAVGADDPEARATLERLGGWGSDGADWDLCLACLPSAPGLRPVLAARRSAAELLGDALFDLPT